MIAYSIKPIKLTCTNIILWNFFAIIMIGLPCTWNHYVISYFMHMTMCRDRWPGYAIILYVKVQKKLKIKGYSRDGSAKSTQTRFVGTSTICPYACFSQYTGISWCWPPHRKPDIGYLWFSMLVLSFYIILCMWEKSMDIVSVDCCISYWLVYISATIATTYILGLGMRL